MFGWGNKGGGTIANGFLQIAGGVALDSTMRNVTDKAGNASTMWMSTSGVEMRGTFALNNGTKKVSFDYSLIATTDKTVVIPNSSMTMLGVSATIDATLRSVLAGGTSPLSLSTTLIGVASGVQYDWVSTPSGAASKTTMWFDATGRMNWRPGTGASSYVRTFDATTITADRVYSLPDSTMTFIGLGAAIDTTLRSVIGGGTSPFQISTTQGAYVYTEKTANTAFDALLLQNNTAATSGNQQYSPAIVWRGYGWKTTATAASQSIDFKAFVIPVQGAANPTGYLSFQNSINVAAYSAYDVQFGNEKDTSLRFNRNSNNFGLLTISRIGDSATPVVYIGCGSGPTATQARIASNGDDLSFGTVSGTTYTHVLLLSTAQKASFAGAINAAALPTTRPATTGDLYQDTAANILSNGDKVVGIRV